MAPKKRSPDDVHDIFNVKVGKPYRGSIVEKIDIETTNLDSGKVKVRRLIHMDDGIILIEDTWHEHGEVFADGMLLPYDEIKFPAMNPADFTAPLRKKDKDDEEEKQRKRDLLRQKAKEMLNKNKVPDYDTNDRDDTGNDDDDDDDNDELRIKVKTPDGDILPMIVNSDDTVDELKNKIEDDHGFPLYDNHELSKNGKPLDKPGATMKDCGIKDGDILNLEPNDSSFTVSVRTPDGKKHEVKIEPTDTVQDLKETVENNHSIPVGDQNLSCRGDSLDDPASTMADNGISNGDVIDLKTNDISVNIRTPDGKTFPILTKPESTVKDLKKAIYYFNGMPIKDQELDFKGKRLKNPSATMNDLGVSDGDTLDLDPGTNGDNGTSKQPKKPRNTNSNTTESTPKAKDRKRVLNPDSAWVFPTKASAPCNGEENNLQGVWSKPPTKGSGTDPVEVNIHPKRKEPKSDGRSDIHGAYGYINGAKPDANGVVNPANVVFYPPGQKNYSPDFDHVGWWSAPESSSKTTVSWRFEGNDCLNVKKHTVNVMGHEMTFVTEWVE